MLSTPMCWFPGYFLQAFRLKSLEGIKEGKYRTVVSKDIVDEYKRTIDKLAHQFPDIIDANSQLELIVLSSDICQPPKLIKPVCADPEDDKFIACAMASKAKIIVSGDRALLNVSGYKGIVVLTPRQFVEKQQLNI